MFTAKYLSIALFFLLLSIADPQIHAAPAKAVSSNTGHTAQHQPLVMKTAVLAALKKHPMSSLGVAHRQVGEAYRSQANALFAGDPSYNISYRSDQIDSDQGYREFAGSLDFPIWLFGQKNARYQLANRLISKADAEQLLLAWQVSGVVLERAWDLRIAQMEVEQARVQQQATKKLEADVKRRVQAGEIARADLLLAQQSTVQRKLAFQQAVAKLAKARNAWKAYTGFNQLPVDLLKQSHVKRSTHDKHPHNIAAQARIKAAQARREDVGKQRRANPVLSFYVKRDRAIDRDPFNNSLGLGISIPFGTKTSSAPRLAEANARVAELMAKEAEREREHELETSQAKLAVQQTRKTLSLAKTQHQLAQQRWKLSKRAFELGESDLFQLILAREQADIQSRHLRRSQLELSLSQARLNHILGAMPL
ncbi:MAG: hypothetical protein COA83_11310 [Methylophaga sp.]|nr:MAG: hypothetical protein COA83_11310 [Methylophaga sp.]